MQDYHYIFFQVIIVQPYEKGILPLFRQGNGRGNRARMCSRAHSKLATVLGFGETKMNNHGFTLNELTSSEGQIPTPLIIVRIEF